VVRPRMFLARREKTHHRPSHVNGGPVHRATACAAPLPFNDGVESVSLLCERG
jgi:hypothetical protein